MVPSHAVWSTGAFGGRQAGARPRRRRRSRTHDRHTAGTHASSVGATGGSAGRRPRAAHVVASSRAAGVTDARPVSDATSSTFTTVHSGIGKVSVSCHRMATWPSRWSAASSQLTTPGSRSGDHQDDRAVGLEPGALAREPGEAVAVVERLVPAVADLDVPVGGTARAVSPARRVLRRARARQRPVTALPPGTPPLVDVGSPMSVANVFTRSPPLPSSSPCIIGTMRRTCRWPVQTGDGRRRA